MPTSMLGLWNTTTRSHWHDPAWRNQYRYNMSRFPVLGDFIRGEDYARYWNDYFKNRPGAGGWANVKYPSLMSGAGTAAGGVGRASVRFVSKNLTRLYDSPVKNTGKWSPKPEENRPIRTYIGPVRGKFRYYGY